MLASTVMPCTVTRLPAAGRMAGRPEESARPPPESPGLAAARAAASSWLLRSRSAMTASRAAISFDSASSSVAREAASARFWSIRSSSWACVFWERLMALASCAACCSAAERCLVGLGLRPLGQGARGRQVLAGGVERVDAAARPTDRDLGQRRGRHRAHHVPCRHERAEAGRRAAHVEVERHVAGIGLHASRSAPPSPARPRGRPRPRRWPAARPGRPGWPASAGRRGWRRGRSGR